MVVCGSGAGSLAASVDHPDIDVDLLRCDVVEVSVVLAMAPVTAGWPDWPPSTSYSRPSPA